MRAGRAGAGNAPGQMHIDDWLRANRDPNDFGVASTLFDRNQEINRPTGVNLVGGGGLLDYNNAQQQLAQASKFDPNASLELVGDPGRENYGPEGNAINNYILHMDNSKLPKFAGADFDTKKYGPLTPLSSNNAGDRVIDPSRVIHDENYGDYTSPRNLTQASNDAPSAGIMGQMEKYMPSVVGAAMSMASGGLVSPALVQALAAAGEGDWGQVGKLAPSYAMSLLGGQVGGALLPAEMTEGLNVIKPWLSGANGIYQAAKKPGLGSGVGAGMTLAQILSRGG